MATKYAKSSDIKVFPTAFRKNVTVDGVQTTYNPEAALNTEFNLTKISNRIGSRSNDSYVISYNSSTHDAEFVIHGYWFKVTDLSTIFGSGPVWAEIQLINNAADPSFTNPILTQVSSSATVLDNLDDESDQEFKGLTFSDSDPGADNVTTFALQLLDDEGNVPAKSYLNISSDQVQNGSGASLPISNTFNTGTLNVARKHINQR